MKLKILFLLLFVTSFAFSTQLQKPHELKKISKNLIKNPTLKGSDGWSHYLRWVYVPAKLFYDPKVSRGDDDSGSFKLSYDNKVGYQKPIKVEIGKTYTFSVYTKTNSWPAPNVYLALRYKSGDTFAWSRWSNSKIGQWQESSIFFTPTKKGLVIPYVYIPEKIDGLTHDIWVDDIYVGEGKGFDGSPALKKSFDGSLVRVDALGNVEVKRDGKFEPFFPLCIYADNTREDYAVYSEQGFNCNMRAGLFESVLKAKEAVSKFNPDGLLSSFDLSAFVTGADWEGVDSKDINVRAMNLRKIIDKIQKRDLADNMLFYYYDNEMWKEWKNLKKIANAVKRSDIDKQAKRQHPIYVLNGNTGVARKYNNDIVNFMDITGGYVGTGWGAVGEGDVSSLEILDNSPDQISPAVIAQMQTGIGKSFRAILFASIAKGAKGMGLWRDFYQKDSSDPRKIRVENAPWWDELPNIRREIDMMMPLIKEPHWTKWSAVVHDKSIVVGTRDLDKLGYIIIANLSSSEKKVKIKLKGLSYIPKTVQDYFTKKQISKVDMDSFTIRLKAHNSGVYKLLK